MLLCSCTYTSTLLAPSFACFLLLAQPWIEVGQMDDSARCA
jgi:hypothetical protein